MTNLFCVYIKQHQELQKQKLMITNNPKLVIEYRAKIEQMKNQALNLLKKYCSSN